MVNLWDLDAEDRRILAVIQVSSGPVVNVAIAVRKASRRSRQRHEFAIWSLGSETWQVEHGVYDLHLGDPHPLLPPMSLLLTNTPERLATTMRAMLEV